jgi:uncharacterized repeat protein (TIGR02543 family)
MSPSSNNDLASLSVSSGTLSPVFNAATTDYTSTVLNNVSSLTITAAAADAKATVAGIGVKTLNEGDNSFQIVVTAQSGSTKTYTLIVTRLPVQATTYTVTFNSQSGSEVASETVADGSKVSKPADPTRDGYTFDGWYKESTYITEWDFATEVVTSNTTLYAKWTSVSTAVTTETLTAVKFYPNPTDGQLTIDNGQWKEGEVIEIYNMSGALVATYTATTTINVSQLPNGTYLLRVGKHTAKFVKQ